MALKKLLIILGLVSFIFILTIFGFYSYNFSYLGISSNQEVWAQFDDFMGGTLNPILAFFAFIALLYTIKLQSDELKDTRLELEKSAKAQQEQSKSLELQNQATKIQIFENTFFQLVRLLIDTRKSLIIDIQKNDHYEKIGFGSMGDSNYPYYKVNGIDEKISYFSYQYKIYAGNEVFKIYKVILDKCYENYDDFNDYYESYTGAYFGQIYQILKLISNSEIKDKQRYINILRAQFPKDELYFLFRHCLGKIGKRKFKRLVEEYQFFEHISFEEELVDYLCKYRISAFGENTKIKTIYLKKLKNDR